MAYRADIEIAVRGAQDLRRLKDEISATGKLVQQLTNYIENFGGPSVVRSIGNLRDVVGKAATAFNDVALGTDEATIAAKKYIEATSALNAGLRERETLLKSITEQERKARLARTGISEVTQYAGPIGPGQASPVALRSELRGRTQQILDERKGVKELEQALLQLEERRRQETNAVLDAKAASAQLRLEREKETFLAGKTAFAEPIGPGQASPVALSSRVEGRIAQTLAERQGRKELNVVLQQQFEKERQLQNSKLDQKARTVQAALDAQAAAAAESAAQTAKLNQRIKEFTTRTDEAARAAKAQTAEYIRQERILKQLTKTQAEAGLTQYAKPIGPKAPPGAQIAAGLTGLGMPTFAQGVRAIGRGGIPGAGVLGTALPGAAISAAFPLITGQGVEAAVGGGVGGLAGGILGSVLGPGGAQMGSFAGGLVGSIIGERIGEANKLTKELQAQLALNNSIEMSEQRLLGLKRDILTAQMQGNELLTNELERRKSNAEVATQLFKTLSELDKGRDGKTKEEQALVDAEKQRAYQAAQVVIQQNNITAALERQKILYNEQLAVIRHQAQLVQGQIDLEKQRVTMGTSLVEARSQAEIAVNNVILQRLEHELQSTTNAKDRARLIQEIYNLEVANARATYQATVARIEAQVRLVELAVEEQEQKYLSLQVERQLAIHHRKSTEALDKALEIQGQAIDKARDNLKYAVEIAKEQLRGADATFQSAVYAAKLKAEMSATAKASGQYADNMQRAAAATEDELRAAVPDYRKMLGITGEPMSGLIASDRPNISFRNLMENGYTKAVQQLKTFKDYEQAVQRYEEFQQYGITGVSKPVKPSGYDAYEMRAAMQQYGYGTSSTNRSSPGNFAVNIKTGPVMQMDGTNYVTQRDLMSATQSAARQGANMALGTLRSDPSTRRAVGLAR